MTAPLAGALVLSALTGLTVSWFFIAWPRRISAEEWIVHRRSLQRAHDTTKQAGGLSILRIGSVAGGRVLPEAAGAVLRPAGPDPPPPQRGRFPPPGAPPGGPAAWVLL